MTMDVPGLPGLTSGDLDMAAPAASLDTAGKSGHDLPRSSDRRYSFLTSPQMPHRSDTKAHAGPHFQRQSPVVRPQSAMGLMSPHSIPHPGKSTNASSGSHHPYHQGHSTYDRPPSAMGTSWTSRGTGEGKPAPVRITDGPSLESRLQALMTDNSNQKRREPPHSSPIHQRSYSHSDGYGPRSQNTHDVTYPQGQSDDVYATVSRRPEAGPQQRQAPGYPSSPGFHSKSGRQRQAMGRDNPAFTPDGQSPKRPEVPNSGASSLDLRNAWQRLYGSNNEINPTPAAAPAYDPRPASRQGGRMPEGQTPPSPYIRRDHNTGKSPSVIRRPGSVMQARTSGEDCNLDLGANTASFHAPPSLSRASPGVTTASMTDATTRARNSPFDDSPRANHEQNMPYNARSYGRQTPPGQSSSNQDPTTSGSHNSSGLSSSLSGGNNVTAVPSGNIMATFKPSPSSGTVVVGQQGHTNNNNSSSNNNNNNNIGPASKYPDSDFGLTVRPITDSPRKQHHHHHHHQPQQKRQEGRQTPKLRSSSPDGHRASGSHFASGGGGASSSRNRSGKHDSSENLRGTPSFQVSFSGSEEEEEESDANYPIDAMDSIFDYNYNDLPSETESCTAQATTIMVSSGDSPRTREKLSYRNPSPKMSPDHPRSKSPGHVNPVSPKSHQRHVDPWEMERSNTETAFHVDAKQTKKDPAHVRQHLLTNYARSRSLEDVRESGGESDLSFDVENTFLTVDPSDQSEMGTLKSRSSSMRAQLNRLEGMYSKVMKTLDDKGPSGARTTRRWSIGSSDTSSLRHQHHHHGTSKHGRSAHSQRVSNKDVRSIGKRFQRLESHVITLARSVAHLSSELRSQNTMTREIENVKREMQELKNHNHLRPTGQGRSELDKYRGWIPPLTNPRRVNKLTKFFGQEPPLLEIFLKRLGYERYVKNFEQEHIGMMELPYMTEDRLQSIGIPMGPRLRILQESQMCFTHDNFNIYIV